MAATKQALLRGVRCTPDQGVGENTERAWHNPCQAMLKRTNERRRKSANGSLPHSTTCRGLSQDIGPRQPRHDSILGFVCLTKATNQTMIRHDYSKPSLASTNTSPATYEQQSCAARFHRCRSLLLEPAHQVVLIAPSAEMQRNATRFNTSTTGEGERPGTYCRFSRATCIAGESACTRSLLPLRRQSRQS